MALRDGDAQSIGVFLDRAVAVLLDVSGDALPQDVENDFEIFDDVIEVTYNQVDRVRDSTGKVALTNPNVVALHQVLKRNVTEREAQASNGRLRTTDARFEVPTKLLDEVTPREGDWIQYDMQRWFVVGVDIATVNSRYRLMTRR